MNTNKPIAIADKPNPPVIATYWYATFGLAGIKPIPVAKITEKTILTPKGTRFYLGPTESSYLAPTFEEAKDRLRRVLENQIANAEQVIAGNRDKLAKLETIKESEVPECGIDLWSKR